MTGDDVTTWFDFSDAAPQASGGAPVDVEEIRTRLLADLRSVLFHLLPNGRVSGGKFFVGDVRGRRGKSLRVELKGPKAGIWHDFATGEGGDIIALWAVKPDAILSVEVICMVQGMVRACGRSFLASS